MPTQTKITCPFCSTAAFGSRRQLKLQLQIVQVSVTLTRPYSPMRLYINMHWHRCLDSLL